MKFVFQKNRLSFLRQGMRSSPLSIETRQNFLIFFQEHAITRLASSWLRINNNLSCLVMLKFRGQICNIHNLGSRGITLPMIWLIIFNILPQKQLTLVHSHCNICRQEFNWLYNSPEGGQLKNQQPAKAPPPPQRKSARFLSIMEQRNVTGTFLKDIRSFHDFQNIHTRNIWILMLYSFSHMLVEYELFRKTWADF